MSAYSLDLLLEELSSEFELEEDELLLEEEESLDEELSSLLLLSELGRIGDFLLIGLMLELFPLFDLVRDLRLGNLIYLVFLSGVLRLKPPMLLPAELEFCLDI